MHLTVAIAVTYAITQNWRAALAVGLIEPAVQTYLIHDRIWTRIENDRKGRVATRGAVEQLPAHQNTKLSASHAPCSRSLFR